MKIILLAQIVGTDFALLPGDATERFGDEEAKRLIVAGLAVPAAEPPVAAAKRRARARKPLTEQR